MGSSSFQGGLKGPLGSQNFKIFKIFKKNQKLFFFELSHSESKKTKKKFFFFYHWVGHSRLRIFSEFSKFSKFSNFSDFLDIWHGTSLDQQEQRYNGHFWLKRSLLVVSRKFGKLSKMDILRHFGLKMSEKSTYQAFKNSRRQAVRKSTTQEVRKSINQEIK